MRPAELTPRRQRRPTTAGRETAKFRGDDVRAGESRSYDSDVRGGKRRRIMDTRAIPEGQWAAFLDSFSRDHAGWLATIEVLDPQSGPLKVAADLPLQGISF